MPTSPITPSTNAARWRRLKGPAVLASAAVGAAYLVYHVHFQQTDDRTRMREGIVRDLERQRLKKEKETAIMNSNGENSATNHRQP